MLKDAVTKSKRIFRGLSRADQKYNPLLTRQKVKKGCRCNSVPRAIRKVHVKVFC